MKRSFLNAGRFARALPIQTGNDVGTIVAEITDQYHLARCGDPVARTPAIFGWDEPLREVAARISDLCSAED
jgi:hypothetical protein